MSRRDLLLYLRDLGVRDAEIPGPLPGPQEQSRPAPAPVARSVPPVAPGPRAEGVPGEPPAFSPDLALRAGSLAEMARLVADCRTCRLCEGRRQVVFGVGDPAARLMFIGEGPGADEDRLGEPFVGRAGQLLTSMIRALGSERAEVYIANIVKCRPPGNRDPENDEAAACLPYLRRQIELVDPAVLVLLGRIAARFLLGTTAPISSYRGRWATWNGRAVMPTFHPAYLLRTPSAKALAWQDLKQIKARLAVTADGGAA